MNKTIGMLLCAIALSAALAGCTPVTAAMGMGAGVGVAAAQEGGIRGAVGDKAIHLSIVDLWMKKDFDMYRRLNLTVQEGRVLITGSVPTPDMRVDAVRLAWQVEGVRQVINEIRVDEGGGVSAYVTDTIATGNIKSKLTFDKYIQSINYNVETVNGTVFLMGVAQDQKELDRVLDIARNTKYVKDVVSYVRLRGETPSGVLPPTEGKASNNVIGGAPAPENNGYQSPTGYSTNAPNNSYSNPAPTDQPPVTGSAVTSEPLR